MVTPAEKRDPNKYCEFHSDTGHSTDECMQLRKQIDEMIKSGKLSQFIRELKQNDKPKAPKKGETSGKDKPLAILMIQPWERVAKPRITQSFSPETAISFPPLGKEDGTEGPMIIEAEMGGHFVHRVYVDGGASSEVLYEHCFVKLRKEIRDQMVPATTTLIGFQWSPSQHDCNNRQTGIEKGAKKTSSLLKTINLDIFAWKPADMTGVPRNIAEHRLNIREGYSPVRQKKRGHAPERNKSFPTLTAQGNEELIIYLAAAKEAIKEGLSDELIAERRYYGAWSCSYGRLSCVMTAPEQDLILTQAEGQEFTYAMRFRFEATNNEAEYETLIAGLRIIEKMGVKNLQAYVDSRLVANQVKGSYIAKESGMRTDNMWMTPICEYLAKEILPEDKKKARAVRRKAARILLANNAYGCTEFDKGMQ
ncbi:reverse transcriptase domain-containing protein [Tanacetum coccineum]|uniref:Reverse transcriptase domain-containing protein n=1 Tax=Tanacetum coccineum TaxID=301880 RepID=A0ABQ4YC85_9ASTR